MSDELRESLLRSGLGLREVARRTSIEPASLSRFIHRERGLAQEAIDALAELFGLELRAKSSKQRKGSTK